MYFIPSWVSLNRLLALSWNMQTTKTQTYTRPWLCLQRRPLKHLGSLVIKKHTFKLNYQPRFWQRWFYWFIERSIVLDIVGSCIAYGRGVILLVSYLLNWMRSWCVASALKHSRILMHKDNIWGHFSAIKTKLNKTTTKHFFSVQDSLIKMLLEEGESSISIKIPYLKMCI